MLHDNFSVYNSSVPLIKYKQIIVFDILKYSTRKCLRLFHSQIQSCLVDPNALKTLDYEEELFYTLNTQGNFADTIRKITFTQMTIC